MKMFRFIYYFERYSKEEVLKNKITFSDPTAKPIRLMHSIVLPRKSFSSGWLDSLMMYFNRGTSLKQVSEIKRNCSVQEALQR